jgi:Fic family protein
LERGTTGHYEVTSIGGEQIPAFIPAPLPPSPPLAMGGGLQRAIEAAVLALGRLDGVSTLLRDRTLFLYAYMRKSRIEGIQSSVSDLLLFELDEVPGVPIDDVVELSNYVAALEHGLARMRDGLPLSIRLIREMRGVLLARGRGQGKSPGEFRRSQNWIGAYSAACEPCAGRDLKARDVIRLIERDAWVQVRVRGSH